MKANAEPFRELDFTKDNYIKDFGDKGIIKTPIGNVHIHKNQFFKLWKNKRKKYFGLIKPTLENPQIIIKHDNKEIFVKVFIKNRKVFFTSLVKDEEGFIVVSNHEKREKQIIKRLKEGSITFRTDYLATALSGSRTPEPNNTTYIEFGLPLTVTKLQKKDQIIKRGQIVRPDNLSGISPAKKPDKQLALIQYLLDNAVKVEKATYSISIFKKLIKGIKTPIGSINMSKTEIEQLNKKFAKTKARKRYFSFIEPTLKHPVLIIKDTDDSFVFVKSFILLEKPFVAVIRQKESENKIITLSVKNIQSIENLIKRGTIVSPDKISRVQPLKGDPEANKTTPTLSQLSLLEISLPFELTKLNKKNKTTKKPDLSAFGAISSVDLQKMKFKTLPFTGDWLKLIGKPSVPFQIMFYGKAGSGKSTITIQFAHYLAANHNMKVLFVAKEEGVSETIQGKFNRLKAYHPNIVIIDSEKWQDYLKVFPVDVVVLDSVNELNISPDDLRLLTKKYPQLSTVQIFKATKEGKFLGQNDYSHLVQAQFRCEDKKCHVEKNRFGGSQSIDIKFE